MTSGSIESRKYRRYESGDVQGTILATVDVKIVNVSIDGAAIETNQRLTVGREYTLKLKNNNREMKLKGKVIWSTLSHSNRLANGDVVPVYKAGFNFSNVLTKEADSLVTFIETNRTGSLEKRVLGVRFKVSQPDGAEIDVPYEYNVKKISLSGMLIETKSSFDLDTIHEMEIDLGSMNISVIGRIANVHELEDGDGTKFEIGVEFIQISDQSVPLLKNYLESTTPSE